MTEHVVTLSVAVEDAASGQEACNTAYRMMRKHMEDMQFIVTDEDGNTELLRPLAKPVLRAVEEQ